MEGYGEKARALLETGKYTLVLWGKDGLYTDTRRGIRPLLELLEEPDRWQGYSAADKVAGKAAAFLYLLLGVESLHAGIVSQSAAQVLTEGGVGLQYGQLVPAIRNRDGTGFCPMETAVREISDPQEAYALLKKLCK